MFTGLIEAQGEVVALQTLPEGAKLEVACPWQVEDLTPGESIAFDGCCLTVTRRQANPANPPGSIVVVDVGNESLRRTTLGGKKIGDSMHLERAMRLGDRLGGHLVQGHIDGTEALLAKRADGEALWLTFSLGRGAAPLLVEKGSIALDGVSLTLTEVTPQSFSVMIIPFTQKETHLGRLAVGDKVNVEVDVIAKHLQRLTDPYLPRAATMSEQRSPPNARSGRDE